MGDSVYDPGVYFVGFWNSFLTFPSTIQTIQYSFEKPEEGVQQTAPLHLRSIDKVPMYLEVSIHYQRKKAELVDLFKKMKTELEQENLYISNVRAELKNVMSLHEAKDCWENRGELIKEFTRAAQRALENDHANCWGLQFYRSTMGDLYESALVETQVTRQRKKIEEARKEAAEVRSKTEVGLAQYRKRIVDIKSAGEAERYNININATTEAYSQKVKAEKDALDYVKVTLSLNGTNITEQELIIYQESLMLGAELSGTQLFYGINDAPAYVLAKGSRRLKAEL